MQLLNQFVTNSRQDVIELLQEFNVSSLSSVSESPSLIVSVTKNSLVECPRASFLAIQTGFQSVTSNTFLICKQRHGNGMVSATAIAIFEELSELLKIKSDEEGA